MCTTKICFFSYLRFKFCKVRTIQFEQKGILFLNTYDGRTLVMKPLRSTWRRTRLLSSSSLMSGMLWWWLGVETEGVLVGLKIVWSISEALRLSTSKTHQDMSFQQGWGMCSPLAKGQGRGCIRKGKGVKLTIIEAARQRLSLANMLLKFVTLSYLLCLF